MKRVTTATWHTEDGKEFSRKTAAMAHETRLELREMAVAIVGEEHGDVAKAIADEIADHYGQWLDVLQLRKRRIKADNKEVPVEF